MHIMEGFLPLTHALGWSAISLPFVAIGVHRLRRQLAEQPQTRLLTGAMGGFAFVLSALKLPSITGSCSHPTGMGLGTALFGPALMTVIGTIVLLFQALLLAHGGITTLGANVFSMAVVGPYVAWGVYRGLQRLGASLLVSVCFAALLSDLGTYLVTSAQLALAFPDPATGFVGALFKFVGVFALTQLPLAVGEGLLSSLVMNVLFRHSRSELSDLGVVQRDGCR